MTRRPPLHRVPVRLMLAIAAVCAAATGAAAAEERGSRQTRDFVAAAAASDTFEMMEAASATAQSRDPQILAFADRMVRDHAATTAALIAATARADLAPPPMQMDGGEAAFLAALQSARGPAFDKLYWHQQALAHRSALTTEQRYAADGDTPAVRDAARQAIPVIAAHLAMAERMDQAAAD